MKLALTFQNYFFNHKPSSVQFIPSDVREQNTLEAAAQLYNAHVHALFNYGMQLCNDNEAVKCSIVTFFINMEESGMFGLPTLSEAELFKQFREILKGQTAQQSMPVALMQSQSEAMFLKLGCKFTYEKIAAIMCIKEDSVLTLISKGLIKSQQGKKQNQPDE